MREAAHVSELGSTEAQGLAGIPAREARAAARGDLTAGAVIAKRYRLDRELGRGGMGVVWEATHQVTRRRVAMKFVIGPADVRADLKRRFLREARAASAANHPNVVEVLDVFELDDGTPVMVMELLSGETLRDRLIRDRKLPLQETASILVPVVAAVGTAHSLGIVHRDLKPENIFLMATGDLGDRVKVLDFGVAKLLATDGDASETDSLTGTGSAVGTPCYMAPEQTTGDKDIDARADIWAIGVIAYECLAGVRPVEGSGIGQVVMKLMSEGIKPLDQHAADLPPAATALVMRMLARDRKDRPQDLVEVQGVLAGFTSVKPRPFDTPSAEARRVDSGTAPSQARTPGVDTESAQAIPNASKRAAPRSMIAGIAGAAVLIAGVVGWKVSARPTAAAAPGLSENADVARSQVPVVLAPPPAASTPTSTSTSTSTPTPTPTPTSTPTSPRKGQPKPAPAASSKPVPSAAAPPAPTAPPAPNRGGLAEKPPF